MPKRKRSQTQAVQENRAREGRGRGEGADYKPWLLVHDVASQGRSSRIWANGRVNHTLSDWETAAYRDFQWDPDVTDIREQYPLPLEATLRIAEEMRIRHPFNVSDRAPVVVTTDFLVTRKGPVGPVLRASAVKHTSAFDLNLARDQRQRDRMEHVLAKLEIERRYWTGVGIQWSLLTEVKLSKVRKINIEFVLGVELDPERVAGYWPRALKAVLAALAVGGDRTLDDLARDLDASGAVARRDFVPCVRWLCAKRALSFDMDRQFDPDRVARDFVVTAATIDAVALEAAA